MLSHVCLLKVDLRFLLHSHRDFKWRLFKPKLGTFSAYLPQFCSISLPKLLLINVIFTKKDFFINLCTLK